MEPVAVWSRHFSSCIPSKSPHLYLSGHFLSFHTVRRTHKTVLNTFSTSFKYSKQVWWYVRISSLLAMVDLLCTSYNFFNLSLQVFATCQQPAELALPMEKKGQKNLVLSSALSCQKSRELDGCSLCSTEGVHKICVFKLVSFRTQSGLCVLVESVELLSPNCSQCYYLHSACDYSRWWLPHGTLGDISCLLQYPLLFC